MEKDLTTIDQIKDLSLKTDKLIDKSNIFMKIFTRGADEKNTELVEFKTIDEKSLEIIADRMPEINRATNVFGRQNSQTTGKLMSLNMISQGPYRRMKQCLAKIERKREALKENMFKLKKSKINLERKLYERELLQKEISEFIAVDMDVTMKGFNLQELDIEIQETAAGISDSNIYIEAAIKEIGMYQDAYEEIRKNNNIPKNWDEKNYEESEIEEHVRTAFLHAIRDIEMTGRLNVGTHEYLEQYGINPHTAAALARTYLERVESMAQAQEYPSIDVLYEFLDKMYSIFKNEHKKAMDRIGLDKIVSEDFLYIEDKEESEE